ncbi:hypothetical protein BaRGS_00010000 [Batillaria attramentaria]|uniref:LITAF domain-containing protein n=1 Tax=Batillaria attramentaria TaxID=370345 RepID=A0ABD0LHL5_9CAEN
MRQYSATTTQQLPAALCRYTVPASASSAPLQQPERWMGRGAGAETNMTDVRCRKCGRSRRQIARLLFLTLLWLLKTLSSYIQFGSVCVCPNVRP